MARALPCWLTLFLGLALLKSAATNDGLFELNIVHYNDFHAHFDETSPTGSVCNAADAPCIGGFARLYTAVSEALEAEPDSLLLNGGDSFQGTIWYNFLKWNVTQHFMNLMPPHDAHVLGNHEFDDGIAGLVPYLELLNAPMLGANVNATLEPDMAPHVRNHVVVQRKGRSIGIIGVLLRSFSAPIGRVIMEDELEAIKRESAILTEQGVDIIILLSHVGYDTDVRLAGLVPPEVDIIVGAHSHTLLFTGATPSGDTPSGNYPTVVNRPDGRTIPIVQASCYTRYLGNIKFYINADGIVDSWIGEPVYLGTSIVQDPRIVALLEPWKQQVDAVGKEVLGYSLVTLAKDSCGGAECNLGNWACDGFLEELMPRATGSAWHYVHACLINAGGLRVQIDQGNVTTEALLMAMPFENYVQVYELKGQYLLEALELSVSSTQTTPGSFYSGRMLQVGGIRVVYNVSAPAMSRVVSADVRCIDCDVPRYQPLDRDATYRLVTQNYIGEGGDGFTMISENRVNVENLEVDYVILQRHMRRQGMVVQGLDGRIQILY